MLAAFRHVFRVRVWGIPTWHPLLLRHTCRMLLQTIHRLPSTRKRHRFSPSNKAAVSSKTVRYVSFARISFKLLWLLPLLNQKVQKHLRRRKNIIALETSASKCHALERTVIEESQSSRVPRLEIALPLSGMNEL